MTTPFPEPVLDVLEEGRLFGRDTNGDWVAVSVDNNGKFEVSTDLTPALRSNDNDELVVVLKGTDDDGNLLEFQAEQLDQGVASTVNGQVTYLARALESQGLDEFVSRVTDSSGTQIDPATDALEDALKSNDTDEFVSRVTGADGVEVQEEAMDTAIAAGDVGLLTYLARSLDSVGQDELVSRLTDSTGTQINPDQSPDYPDDQTVGHDLIGTGDLTIGPVSVARSEALVVAANSTDGNSFDVTVDWEDGSGNVFQAEAAADIGLNGVTEDWARLVRKGPQAVVTVTDTSGAGSNNVNVHIDTER
jgi:hypothetical protein